MGDVQSILGQPGDQGQPTQTEGQSQSGAAPAREGDAANAPSGEASHVAHMIVKALGLVDADPAPEPEEEAKESEVVQQEEERQEEAVSPAGVHLCVCVSRAGGDVLASVWMRLQPRGGGDSADPRMPTTPPPPRGPLANS